MKILYVTTIGSTMGFFIDFIKDLVSAGHTVDIACNESIAKVPSIYAELGCKVYHISCTRNPLNGASISAIRELKKIINGGQYDIVHCHTPVAAMCTRLACIHARRNGTRVFYTAHGFHFYQGAPLKNWVIYYPVEKFCSYLTDLLITINQEDYALAQKKMKAAKVEYVPGVGVNIQKFSCADRSSETRAEYRRTLGIPENAKLLVSVGELNENKNHRVILRALALLNDKNIHYAIAGQGGQAKLLEALASELGISDQFHLLGYRNDIDKLYNAADICCLPSFREGLPVAAIEGLASALPLVAADNRGTRDLCENGVNGYICDPTSPSEFAAAIKTILQDTTLCEQMAQANLQTATKFEAKRINKQLYEIYF